MDFEEGFERLTVSDALYDSWTRDHQPYICTFELLPNCNFKCIHCYLGVHRTVDEILDTDRIKYVLDELKRAGVLQLALTGGECTLRKDFLEIYEYAKRSGFIVTVFTNASHITDRMIRVFREYPPFSVDISLYGASEQTYKAITGEAAFQTVLDNVRKLYENGIHFTLKTPFIIQNIADGEKLREIARSFDTELRIGFAMSPTIDRELYPETFAVDLKTRFLFEADDAIALKSGYRDADTENHWGEVYDRGEFVPQFICNPGVSDVFVDYKGNVCPCIAYRSKGISIFEKPFDEIWSSFKDIKKIPALPGNKCIKCDSRYFCNICVAEQDTVYNDMCHRPPEVCAYAKARKRFFKDDWSVERVAAFLEEQKA